MSSRLKSLFILHPSSLRVLILRLRQLGDIVLTTPLLTTLKRTFPDARVDIVLNERLAPLLQEHPDVARVIPFSYSELHNLARYIPKVWRTMRSTRYDAIIDMRSTPSTLLFSLFSLRTPVRSGLGKHFYARLLLTHTISPCGLREQMLDHNLSFLAPLGQQRPLSIQRRISLYVSDEERRDFRAYMSAQGIDFSRPILLAGVTAKLPDKRWRSDYVVALLGRLLRQVPTLQIVLNYAPGREADDARAIHAALGNAPRIFLNIEAKGVRQLMAMASLCDAYLGNEGGARHVAHAFGKPTFAICSPRANKSTWLPIDDPRHLAVAPSDVASPEALAAMTYQQRYDLMTPDIVWQHLLPFIPLIEKG